MFPPIFKLTVSRCNTRRDCDCNCKQKLKKRRIKEETTKSDLIPPSSPIRPHRHESDNCDGIFMGQMHFSCWMKLCLSHQLSIAAKRQFIHDCSSLHCIKFRIAYKSFTISRKASRRNRFASQAKCKREKVFPS